MKNNNHKLMETANVLNEVLLERQAQEKKWGNQNHAGPEYLMILGEEVGEANKEYLEEHFRLKQPIDSNSERCEPNFNKYRKELIQVAAVAVSMIESLDRNGR